jgi:hypothetical protein
MVSRLPTEESGSFLELVARVSRERSTLPRFGTHNCEAAVPALRHPPYCEIPVTSRRLKNERSRSSQKEPQSC